MLDGEEHIIIRAVQGDSSAFGALYDHYQPKIYRFVLIKVSHREEAEDITHQVFINAWASIASYKNLGFPFSSWLYRIARNQVIDFYRTKKNDASLDEINPDTLPDIAESTGGAELRFEMQRVMGAIQKMKQEYQDVIMMRFVEELNVKETAHAIHKTEGAVKVLQHRALKQLKLLLQQ